MDGSKSAVKFKLSFWLAQNEILTNFKFVDTTRKQACTLSFHTYNLRRLAKKIFKKIVLSAVIANFVNLRRGGLSVIASRLQKWRDNPQAKMRLKLWIATPCIHKAHNDGLFCLFEFLLERENPKILVILSVAKNPQNLRHALNSWILRCAQYDTKSVWYDKKVSMTKPLSFWAFARKRPNGLQGVAAVKNSNIVILSEWNERKIQRILRHALNSWILRYAQYDKK